MEHLEVSTQPLTIVYYSLAVPTARCAISTFMVTTGSNTAEVLCVRAVSAAVIGSISTFGKNPIAVLKANKTDKKANSRLVISVNFWMAKYFKFPKVTRLYNSKE